MPLELRVGYMMDMKSPESGSSHAPCPTPQISEPRKHRKMARLHNDERDGPREAAEQPRAEESPERAQHEEDRQRVGRQPVDGAVVVRKVRRHPDIDRDFDRDVQHHEE